MLQEEKNSTNINRSMASDTEKSRQEEARVRVSGSELRPIDIIRSVSVEKLETNVAIRTVLRRLGNLDDAFIRLAVNSSPDDLERVVEHWLRNRLAAKNLSLEVAALDDASIPEQISAIRKSVETLEARAVLAEKRRRKA